MAATPVEQPVIPPADVVGNAFVQQYYHILHQSPELVHRFYQDVSKLGRPLENGVMTTTTTMLEINEKILSLGYGELRAEITTVDSQESHGGGVLVLVMGYLIGSDNVQKKFTQSFFLAPQDKGYFVLNDVFRYVDEAKRPNESHDPASYVEALATPEQDSCHIQENHITEEPEEPAIVTEEISGGEVHNLFENGDGSVELEEVPIPEVVDAVPDNSQMVAENMLVVESDTKTKEVTKKSYASILKVMKENAAASPAPSPVRSMQKSQDLVSATALSSPAPEANLSSPKETENGNSNKGEAESPSIYVKGLPSDATPALLENEFKKFGPIKPGGIQVRCQKGFCFGFVEFEVATAVQNALEASPLMINGCRVTVEEKRSTSRGNSRGRFASGGGSRYRNDGGRGRGNFEGGYGRNEFGNRGDFGNRNNSRGGFSNRGGEGYRRTNSGRGIRGGMPVNAAAKETAPQVSATA